jgi:branched-chain amino acid transport system permease protein
VKANGMGPYGVLASVGIALALGAALAGGISSNTVMSLLTQATIYAVFATGLGVLLRQNGMVSFGHALFFGGTGYVIGVLLQARAVPGEAAILIAVVGISAFAFLYGLIIVRVPGVAFGMITLAVGQMFYVTSARSRGLTGGADGMNIDWAGTLFGLPLSTLHKPAGMFMLSWAVLVLTVGGLALLLRGRFGSITEATRDNEERARFIGIRTLLPRAAVFALSAFVTSLAGVLSAIYTGFVSPESMELSVSAIALMMVVVGGTRALWGPALGAVVYFLTKDVLGDYAQHWMGIFGVALIAVIVFFPEGIAGGLLTLWRRAVPGRAVPKTAPSAAAAARPASDRLDFGPPA